ncbi:MAG TPA: hypothetical protein VF245_12640 [Solirubrobacterales bacterium]
MAPEAVSIEDSFKAVAGKLHEQMEGGGKGLTPEAITEAVALEYGVPLDQLIEAVFKESVLGMLFMAMAGPRRGLCTSNIAAFMAGVAWEQGRRG